MKLLLLGFTSYLLFLDLIRFSKLTLIEMKIVQIAVFVGVPRNACILGKRSISLKNGVCRVNDKQVIQARCDAGCCTLVPPQTKNGDMGNFGSINKLAFNSFHVFTGSCINSDKLVVVDE